MSMSSVNGSIGGINSRLDAQTVETMNRAIQSQAKADSLSQKAAEVALYNMQESFRAGSYAAGIKTERGLLSKGTTLAKKV